MQSKNDSERGAGVTMERREFLVLGSAAMVGLAATNLHSDVLTTLGTPMPLLSIGFWNGSAADLRLDADKAPYRAIVAADRLVAADSSLVRNGARVTMHGFWRAPLHRDPLALALRAQYPSLDGSAASIPFIAWTWHPHGRVSNDGRFDVPVSDALELVVERRNRVRSPRAARFFRERLAMSGVKEQRAESILLSSVTGSRGLKLRRGVYFVAVRESESETVPSWSSFRVATGSAAFDPKGEGVLRAGSGAAAPFSYLVLSVDSARA